MSKKRADRKLAGTIIGWTVAAALAVGGFICVRNFASRDLSLMLCIDGKTVCAVESRAAVKLCAKQPIIIPEIWLDKPHKFGIIETNQDKFLKIKKYYKRRQYYGTERQ